MANVYYTLEHDVVGYPWGREAPETFGISSEMLSYTPEQLKQAGVKAEGARTRLIEDAFDDFQDWYRLDWGNPNWWSAYTRKIKDPLFAGPDMTAPGSLYGHPIVSATSLNQAVITDEHLIFGPAPEVNVGRWGGVVFAASNVSGTDFATLRTSFRAVTAIDVGVTQPGAFTVGLNVDTTNVYTLEILT